MNIWNMILQMFDILHWNNCNYVNVAYLEWNAFILQPIGWYIQQTN